MAAATSWAERAAIGVHRDGGTISHPARLARLGLVLTSLRVRDDARGRMDPSTATRTADCGPTC
jgi:hypothetical protein